MMPWTRVVIHHSLTKDGPKVSWNAIRKYHTDPKPDGRGWRDVGYHFGVELIGARFNVLVGMPLTKRGIHAPGANTDGIGICFIGNYDKKPPVTALLKFGAKYIIVPMIVAFDMHFPDCLVGHNEVTKNRTCPGQYFDMSMLEAHVGRALP